MPFTPHNVQVSPDGKRLFAVGVSSHASHGAADGSKGKLLVMETSGGDQPILLDAGDHPAHVVTYAAGARAFVSDSGANNGRDLYVANMRGGTVSVIVATIRTGKGAHGVAISKDGRYVFVTNIEAATLSVIDTASNKVVATHRVGAGPNGVTFLE